ncbi:SDR family NAD(P)-dependent oxidoreductase [[Mycobacterium] crassicus]|uniref:SDR family NAD(P)-dependent oxidoreductase n=1 Tax=[Mycobacterium] crassicus TaxID=2872309 RepID=A0ABU5XI79_9MYCO|nr:SDR family NAD(P)-dependent oxidoreductase [Mycolicibacter sp. MYC098]MEB3021990.1 SDR family NAD(P)-dependent oxidoreductase [Mycolicibacter sp. MYC098]
MDLNGKAVLLSGATGGLGRAIAEALAARGARLILSSRKAEDLEQLAASLPGTGHTTVVCDLAEEGAVPALLERAGDFDVLVANAALPGSGRLESFSQDEIGRALRVNLESPVRLTRELLPVWQRRGSGHFVFISSLSGFAPLPRSSIYAATKFGLRGFALSLREDLRGSGVGVSVVSPGAIREAGMFADSGVTPPPPMGSGTPKQVGGAVVRAIEHDKSEVCVSPLRQRAFARFAMLAPEISGRIVGPVAAKAADEVAAGQTEKR